MSDQCTCGGCRLVRETGYDVECYISLEYEAEYRAQEAAVEFQDNLETLGASRYGNPNWFWNKPYVWKAEGYAEDEIPF